MINAAAVNPTKFLIVDDDSDDTDLFAEAVTAVEPETVCYRAGDGVDALEQLCSSNIDEPDIIFLDLNMPNMNGWECLNRLKSDVQLKDIPVIVHTTSTSTQDRKMAMQLGAICFFTKPDDFKMLQLMLKIVIDNLKRKAVDDICNAVYRELKLN